MNERIETLREHFLNSGDTGMVMYIDHLISDEKCDHPWMEPWKNFCSDISPTISDGEVFPGYSEPVVRVNIPGRARRPDIDIFTHRSASDLIGIEAVSMLTRIYREFIPNPPTGSYRYQIHVSNGKPVIRMVIVSPEDRKLLDFSSLSEAETFEETYRDLIMAARLYI